MKRNDWLWLLAIILLLSIGMRLTFDSQKIWLRWEISSKSDMSGAFWLELNNNSVVTRNSTARPISKADQAELLHNLEEAEIWNLQDCNCGQRDGRKRDFESKTLFTRLEVCIDGKVSRTFWRGVSKAQLRVVDAIFQSPLDTEARQLLAKITPMPFSGETSQLSVPLFKVPPQRILPIIQYQFPGVKLAIPRSHRVFYMTGTFEEQIAINSEMHYEYTSRSRTDINNLDSWPFLR